MVWVDGGRSVSKGTGRLLATHDFDVDGDVNGKRFQMEMIKVREVMGFKSNEKKRKGSHDWTK